LSPYRIGSNASHKSAFPYRHAVIVSIAWAGRRCTAFRIHIDDLPRWSKSADRMGGCPHDPL